MIHPYKDYIGTSFETKMNFTKPDQIIQLINSSIIPSHHVTSVRIDPIYKVNDFIVIDFEGINLPSKPTSGRIDDYYPFCGTYSSEKSVLIIKPSYKVKLTSSVRVLSANSPSKLVSTNEVLLFESNSSLFVKQLKIWNGRGQGRYTGWHFYVAAYSQKQAAELIGKAGGGQGSSWLHEIRVYYHAGAWGNRMDGIIPKKPGVWATKGYGEQKPKKII